MAVHPPTPAQQVRFAGLDSVEAIADLLGTTVRRLNFNLYSPRRDPYGSFQILKSNGSFRTILTPPPYVKAYQRTLLACLTDLFIPKACVHGFVPTRSVLTNARPHVLRRLLLNIDLVDFFPSINFGRVMGVFGAHPFGFPKNVAAILAHICCYRGTLPQGAPTSPVIANLVCRGMDRGLEAMARRNRSVYSRYADDMTISTADNEFPPAILLARLPAVELGGEVIQIIRDNGFAINAAKTRVADRRMRQAVTGLVVNEKVNVPRAFIRSIRSLLHNIEKHGDIAATAKFRTWDTRQRLAEQPTAAKHVWGKIDYLEMVRGRGDCLTTGLAVRAAASVPRSRWGGILHGKAAQDVKLLSSAIFVVIGRNVLSGEEVHATACAVKGVGIVTARHVFDGRAGYQWKIQRAVDRMTVENVSHARIHPHIDVAILETKVPMHASFLPCGGNAIGTDQEVSVAGFPYGYLPADSLDICRTRIRQIRVLSAVQWLLIDADLDQGHSGGPVISTTGEVVGIVAYDHTNSGTPNGATAISHVATVAAETPKAL